MIEESEYYWVKDDTIIFKPDFDEPLNDKHFDIIKKCSKVIFSNYNSPSIAIETNNDFELKYSAYWKQNKYNQPIQLIPEINELFFGMNFNQSINFVEGIKKLSLGYNFNQSVELPLSIKYLKLETYFNNPQLIDNLPNGVEELVVGYFCGSELNNLPNSIKIIKLKRRSFGNEHNKELNCLPESIEYLELPNYYNLKITKSYPNLKTIVCTKDYEYTDDFENIEILYK